MTQCAVDQCDRPMLARGWCSRHYQRWLNHGDPTFAKTGRGLSDADRFWRLVVRSGPDDCWLWQGTLSRGYGYITFGGGPTMTRKLVHRFAYELEVGPISHGLEIDHLCMVRNCVNPAHLEPVTHVENMARRGPTRQRLTSQ